MVQDADQWYSQVNTVRCVQIPKGWGISCLSKVVSASQEGSCSMDIIGVPVKHLHIGSY
jgi:hypothetical protein